jgi:hypothetical protein
MESVKDGVLEARSLMSGGHGGNVTEWTLGGCLRWQVLERKIVTDVYSCFSESVNRCALMQVGEIKRSGQCPQHQVDDCECGTSSIVEGSVSTRPAEKLRGGRFGRNTTRLTRRTGTRRMQTAERAAVIGSPDLESLTTSHIERAFLTVRQELKRFQRKGLGYKQRPRNAQARGRGALRRLQFCPQTSHARDNASGGRCIGRKAVELRTGRGNDSRLHA